MQVEELEIRMMINKFQIGLYILVVIAIAIMLLERETTKEYIKVCEGFNDWASENPQMAARLVRTNFTLIDQNLIDVIGEIE